MEDEVDKQTFNRTSRNWNATTAEAVEALKALLIVPVGIEIRIADGDNEYHASFNRTSRNWNL